MQQRYYDPAIGRFLSVDPDAADTTTAWNFNRYNYAANNPYKFTDPDGRAVQALWGAPVGFLVDIAAQKIADPDAPINYKSAFVSAGVGAVTGGIGSIARVAAVRGTVTVGQAVALTAGGNAVAGAAGSAVDSAVNGEAPSLWNMAVSGALNGALSGAAGLAGAPSVLAQKMSAASPMSPQGIGNHIINTTQAATGAAGTAAVQGAASTGGRVADIASQAGGAAAQKKIEERFDKK